jgi:hypothetical protein
MLKIFAFGALGLAFAASAGAAAYKGQMLYEESAARQEERLVISAPIGGVRNHYWFDYRTNVNEAKKELASDLRHVSDTEDLRDAWDEYRHELNHERAHYVKEMAERGYRQPTVTVVG